MSDVILPEQQVDPSGGGAIVLIVMDGLGGLPHPDTGKTELETARTAHLDALAARSSLGMLQPVAAGITPGSGPGHLSLFGYDPTRYTIGRGALSALGVGVELRRGDVAARLNLATFDGEGRVSDRRAGRPSDEEARRVVERVMAGVEQPDGVELSLIPEKEHRVVLHLRGPGVGGADLGDTDPLEDGRPPLALEAGSASSEPTAVVVRSFLDRARRILGDEPVLNGFLARGFAEYRDFPTLQERFGLSATVIARYPMYRGVARLVGMAVDRVPDSLEATVGVLEETWGRYDFYFLHFKDTDTKGHDGDFDGKVAAIEAVDALVPRVLALGPAVVAVTGDHSTPTLYREHSWHHVPTLLHSRWPRPTGTTFGESACRAGDLGVIHGTELMPLALAHAGRLVKYGA
ncbi:MAG: 2,3-bisphosphoglycerate-independent phosphoglycerate mutase [Gemmatimonadetes bacterium]|nr:2,3-bisphosphoglycerate-independent phosphoglycerate mutase [Gemmatimonadota bacterium]